MVLRGEESSVLASRNSPPSKNFSLPPKMDIKKKVLYYLLHYHILCLHKDLVTCPLEHLVWLLAWYSDSNNMSNNMESDRLKLQNHVSGISFFHLLMVLSANFAVAVF